MQSRSAIYLFVLNGLFVPVLARAGHQSSGGADSFQCQVFPGGESRFYLADTYTLFQNKSRLAPLGLENPRQIFRQMVQSLNELQPGQGDSLAAVSKKLKWKKADLEKLPARRLPDLPDDFIRQIPKNCRKVQLAIQDFSTGVVLYDATIYQQLSESEKILVRLHEAFIYIRQQYGNTEAIRKKVKNIVDAPGFLSLVQETSLGRRLDAKCSGLLSGRASGVGDRAFYNCLLINTLAIEAQSSVSQREKLQSDFSSLSVKEAGAIFSRASGGSDPAWVIFTQAARAFSATGRCKSLAENFSVRGVHRRNEIKAYMSLNETLDSFAERFGVDFCSEINRDDLPGKNVRRF